MLGPWTEPQMDRAAGPGGAEIRQANAADGTGLRDFFARLSLRTRVLRFSAPITPTSAMLRRLAGGAASVDAVVAVRGGVIIGHGMAVDQDGSQVATLHG